MKAPTWLPVALALALLVLCQVSGSHGIREHRLYKREYRPRVDVPSVPSNPPVPPPPPDVLPRFLGNVSKEEEDSIHTRAVFYYDHIKVVDGCGGEYKVSAGEGILFYSRYDNKSFQCNNTFSAVNLGENVDAFCPHVLLRFNCFFEELYVRTKSSSQTTEDRLCRTSTILKKKGEAVRFSYMPRVTLFSSGYVCLVGVPSLATPTTAAQLQQTDTKVKCGIRLHSQRHSGMRVVGGILADELEFPWMAYLKIRLVESSSEIRCGGSLISPHVVLTAAHCIDFEIEYIRVGLGLLKHTDEGKGTIWIETLNFTKHPSYDPIMILNDIAIVILKDAVPVTEQVRPICLPKEVDYALHKATATGWGNQNYEGQTSLSLQEVDLEITGNAECQEGWRQNVDDYMTIADTQVCAYGEGKDTCTGDSGGPLSVEIGDQTILVGITSFGYKCAEKGTPGVYTRVSKFLPWISQYLGGDYALEDTLERSRRKTITLKEG